MVYSVPSLVPFEQLLDPMKKTYLWKPYFFPRQAIAKILFVLQFRYTGDTPCQVWFDLDILTRWKRPVFKIRESWNSQVCFSKLTFFPRQAIAKILLFLQSRFTWCTPYPVWFDLNNSLTDEKDLFLKFVIREIHNFPYENFTFFRGKL